nr:MAG TPA: hypothetical protein [Caudoviricetes sp.]
MPSDGDHEKRHVKRHPPGAAQAAGKSARSWH